MSKKEKLLKRCLGKPKDFSWKEFETLIRYFGFEEKASGKTGGCRRRFVNANDIVISLHKPHPSPFLKRYQLEQVLETLRQENLI